MEIMSVAPLVMPVVLSVANIIYTRVMLTKDKRLATIEALGQKVVALEEKAQGGAAHMAALVQKVDELGHGELDKEVRLALIEKAIAEIAPVIPDLSRAIIRLTTLAEMWGNSEHGKRAN